MAEFDAAPLVHAQLRTKPPRRGYWYKNYITECPVCGRGGDTRERQYTPAPPKHSKERWEYDQVYDYCLE